MIQFDNLIERCHERHKRPLRQRKTVPVPAMLYQRYPYQYSVYCANRYQVLLNDLERANISFSGIGKAPKYENGSSDLREHAYLERQKMKDLLVKRWTSSWGIHIYTGIPSEDDNAQWHDLDFKYEAICAEPEKILTCIETLVNAVENPLLTLTKSGGLRFSCRVTDYLHPEDEETRLFIYKYVPTHDNPTHRDIYLEIFGNRGKSRWDARYEILMGNLLDPPVVPKEVFFAPIDALHIDLHKPVPEDILQKQTETNSTLSLRSRNLNLAKNALLARGFHYLRQENHIHHWIRYGGDVNNTDLMLWEKDDTVWIRTSTPNVGLPSEATPIAYVWSDTSIPPPTRTKPMSISDKMLAVQEGKLSPLAIKRKVPILHQESEKSDPSETSIEQIKRILDSDARIIGLTITDGHVQDATIDYFLSNSDEICISLPFSVEQYLRKKDSTQYARWKDRMFRWEKVKDIPINERMANPFAHGNVCEDAERCNTLENKGVNPSDILCPQCPVYTTCQERGFLSQLGAMRQAKKQIIGSHRMFFYPQHAKLMDEILHNPEKEENRQCIIHNIRAYRFFLICNLSRNVLEQWIANWQGKALGDFSKNLLYALEIRRQSHSEAVKRIRTVMQTFEMQEEDIIQQMCHINASGRVVERGYVEAATGKELAQFSVEFDAGIYAYLPIDSNAARILSDNGQPHLNLTTFKPNEDISIPLSLDTAIKIGIYNIDTDDEIEKLPTVCPMPTWTFWHQLKHFLTHYTENADAPLRWDHKILNLELPPVLHPRIKQLVLLDSTESPHHLHSMFPEEKVSVNRIKTMPWQAGNRVFQIRTGLYPHEEILDYSHAWDIPYATAIGERFLTGICEEIRNTPKVKHTIIADRLVLGHARMIIDAQNVCFVDYSIFRTGSVKNTDVNIEDADVLWFVGMPKIPIGDIWKRSQVLFGHEDIPLCYDTVIEPFHFKDKRIQKLYLEKCVAVINKFVRRTMLNSTSNKKVILLTSLMLPDITDRPETILFDWEDFEIAGGLAKLEETIKTREHFENEKANLTAESGRDKVQHVLGCSVVYANRVLNKLRGGNIHRVPFREQILALLADGEKRTSILTETIEGNPTSIKNELKRLLEVGDIVKVRHGVYTLPDT